ncbi:hypothetical protein SARC_05700 [Sphaeroforma arctica JP610]|uniref:Uncharacterized protein n=1 Tax=Sphaeroforma arctica JP610 TaxID=667725 RepID=A0A0L0FYS9_9EUKA|nr:hypothetical protein SARC_05700 [Sphaeroforma arctica JP610]KNC82002.1 hypothetical protein SARC_05700 [Sphaeroforma arctica JP610]|eukprot:XP_014155904.1 hypothetical protein SARC_05700 [Sphaeroforma arctica JP610]
MSYLKGQLSFLAGRSGAVLQSLAIKGNTQRFFSASTRATYSAHTHVQAGANYIKNQAVAMVTRARSQPVRKVAVPVVSYMVISSIFRDAAQADGIIPGGDSVGGVLFA